MEMKSAAKAILVILSLMLGLVLAAPASAEESAGRSLYLRYCGACHGPQGKGDGIVGTFLTKKPADLTQIAKKNGGSFPFNRVMQFIDGTKDVRAHGNADMPVWGEIFKQNLADSPSHQAEVRGKILLITDYLQSIQAR